MRLTLLALRAPALLPNALFESHFAYWLAAIALALVLFLAARAQNNRRLLHAAAALLALTLLWIASAFLFDTPAERLRRAHSALAAAAATQDLDTLFSYLTSDFAAPNLGIRGNDLKAARDEIDARLKQYGIKSTTYTDYSPSFPAPRSAYTQCTLLTQTQIPGASIIKSSWLLHWIDEPNTDWRIDTATLTKLGDNPIPAGEPIR